MPTLTSAERIGSLVAGRYEIRRLIGEGGFSSVFEAVHVVTGRMVAVKVLHPHLVATEQIRHRFLMEARAMARVNHDGIVQVLDADTDADNTVFMVLELLSGEPLESTLSRVRLTWDETVNVGLDVLSALSEAHKHKIIHRDIKPGNIFIVHKSDGSSHAKLLDFGIAHVARVDGKPITQQGMILGTPEYMSPEQGRAGMVGPESDIWSVGIVLFECLTGYTPFVAESTTEVLLKVATTNAPSLRSLCPEVPAPIAAVIDRSLDRDVQVRYRTADQMREALLAARVMIDSERGSPQAWEPPLPAPVVKRPAAPTLDEYESPLLTAGRPSTEQVPVTVTVRNLPQPSSILRAPSGQFNTESRATNSPENGTGRHKSASARKLSDAWPSDTSGERLSGLLDNPFSADAELGEKRGARAATDDKSPGEPSQPSHRRRLDSSPSGTADVGPAHDDRSPRRSDTEGYRAANRTTFKAPPIEPGKLPTTAIAAGLGVLLLGGLTYLATRSPTDDGTTGNVHAAEAGTAITEPSPDVPAIAPEPTPPESSMVSRYLIAPPGGGAASDETAEFARHAVVSSGTGTTQRVVATCVPSSEGAGVYLYQLSAGTPLASSRGQVACSGFDLGVISDISGDGTDDVVALSAGGNELAVLDSRSMMASQRIPARGARGLVTGLTLDGEPVALVYTEESGLTGPTSVKALMLRSRRVRWQVQGSGVLGRVGQPVELGLSIGPDASGDGVPDVAVGIGPMAGAAPQDIPARSRCVQLFSGADGTALWTQPFCQLRGSGSQSVSLGPDVDGDGRGDVAIGTDQPGGSDPPVVIVSGLDAHILRSLSPPPGDGASGFGWPVALAGDIHGDGSPDIAVGSIGQATYFTLFDGTSGRAFAQERLGGVGAGTLRLMPIAGGTASAPWNIIVGNPGEGLHAYNAPVAAP